MAPLALLFTDLVDSTALAERLGEPRAAAMWAEHDRRGRDLIATHGGREIDHTDGFFAVFASAADAAACALGYQAAMAELGLSARIGIHVGPVLLRDNLADDVQRGAKPVEVDGLAKPLAARVMAHAGGGQALLTAAAREALGAALPAGATVVSQGHHRLKGISEPVELFELGNAGACAFVPPPDSDKVYRVVRSGAGLWQPLREVRHNLVAERDAFIGRVADLRALAQRVDDGARLVSVLGAGGCGKTRFVRRYAWAWPGDWPGGVVFADLSEARSAEGIFSVLGQALGAPLAGADPAVQIGHAIAARGRCLVILDNFEQLLTHAEATVGSWLGRAAEATFIVTSRERLQLRGEQVFALEPLPLADDAVALFAARARAQRPDFALAEANRADVERIVALLDGLPLAIELAAARVRVLSTAQLLQRLSDRFSLLAGARGVASRQAALRAAIDWSWNLLAPWEQAALAQCAVFDGGFTLEAAEQVLDLAAWPDAPAAVDAVQALVDKSLLRSWVPAADSRYAFDEPYFGMYVSIQAYADEKLRALGADAALAVEQRHGACFAVRGADTAIEALYGPDSVPLRRALALELDNLISASRRALCRGDGTTALATYHAAWEVLDLRGPFGVAVDLGGPLVAAGGGLDDGQRARAMCLRARAAHRAGRRAQAQEWAQAGLALAQAAHDRQAEGLAQGMLGHALLIAGAMAASRAHLDAALHIHRALGHRRAEGTTLSKLGMLLGDTGRTEEALAHYAQALAIHRAMGNRVDESNVLSLSAVQHEQSGATGLARAGWEASLAISEALEDRVAIGETLSNLGLLAFDHGDAREGAARCERALAVHREVGNRRFEGYTLGDIGRMHLDQGRLAEARPCLDMALLIARETGERRQQGALLGVLGTLELRSAQADAARANWDTAEALLREVDDKLHLARVYCGRADLALAEGDRAAAAALLGQARGLAVQMQAGPESPLGRTISQLAATLARTEIRPASA